MSRVRTPPRTTARPATPSARGRAHVTPLLRLQATAGNQAVVTLLQRDAKKKGPRELPPIVDLTAGGTLDQTGWTTLYDKAVQARQRGGTDEAKRYYAALLTDVATVVGVSTVPGLDPHKIHLGIGVHEKDGHKDAKGGLNLSMEAGDEPGHTGWVDAKGQFGVPLDLGRRATKPQIAIVVNYSALKADKAFSLRVIRHELVHATHQQLIVDAVASWEAKGRKGDLGSWLGRNARRLGLSDVDLALIKTGVLGRVTETEILAYTEGFMTEFHHTKVTRDGTFHPFFELLGVVETKRTYPWGNADKAVKLEALSRLRSYHATLDKPHKDAWKTWVTQQLVAAANDRTGRKEFLTKLAEFVT